MVQVHLPDMGRIAVRKKQTSDYCHHMKTCLEWGTDCTNKWCPFQAILCRYKSAEEPYFEAIRGLPMPENIYRPIIRSDRYIHVSPDHFPNPSATEKAIIETLDDTVGADKKYAIVRQAILSLSPRLRKMVGLCIALQTFDRQFDFSAVAHRLTVADHGIPMGSPPSSWTTAKSRAKSRVVEAWIEALPKILSLLRQGFTGGQT